MDYDEMSDEEFYNLSPEEHEKYLIKSYQNTRKIEILEKLDFSQWTKEELLEVITEYEFIKLAQEKSEEKIIELTTISNFVQDGTYKEQKLEFEEYKILETTETTKEEVSTGYRRKLRPCILLKTLELEQWSRRELLDLIKEYDIYVNVITKILKEDSLSVLNYIQKKYCGNTRRPTDQYNKETLKKIERRIKQHNEIRYNKNVNSLIEEKIKENQDILKICKSEKNFIIINVSKFSKFAKEKLEKLGYKVYFYGEIYSFNGIEDIVKNNEILIAIKE